MIAIRHPRVPGDVTFPNGRGIRNILIAVAILVATAFVVPDAGAHGRSRQHHHGRKQVARLVVVPPRTPRYAAVPGYVGSPVIHCGRDRFHWSASLGLYVPNLWLQATYGESAPRGSVYWDPYCGTSYRCLSDYRAHLYRCGHPAALMLAVGWPACR